MTAKSTAPKDLEARGRRFWRTVTTSWTLEADELELLTEVCRTLDICERLQALLVAEGLTVPGSTGQPRVHPAAGELRSSRQVLGRLLAQLELPDLEGESLPSPATARARKAARSRWDRAARLQELRKERRGSTA
jgi:hypothetical protein